MDDATRDPRNALRTAYLRTTYRVCADGIDFEIVLGQVAVALDRWLRENGWRCWAFISACNPGSRLLSDRMNRIRHEALISHLVDQGRTWFPGIGVASGGSWRSEQSAFVPAIAVAEARWIARRFGQSALLYGRRSKAPRAALVFILLNWNAWGALHVRGNLLYFRFSADRGAAS